MNMDATPPAGKELAAWDPPGCWSKIGGSDGPVRIDDV
jgi:hypothetical protein